jgi:hypothetical protein
MSLTQKLACIAGIVDGTAHIALDTLTSLTLYYKQNLRASTTLHFTQLAIPSTPHTIRRIQPDAIKPIICPALTRTRIG